MKLVWLMLSLLLALTSSARRSNGSRTCHPRHSKDLWPGSSQHRPRRTHRTGGEPAVSALPQMTHTAVAVERKEDGKWCLTQHWTTLWFLNWAKYCMRRQIEAIIQIFNSWFQGVQFHTPVKYNLNKIFETAQLEIDYWKLQQENSNNRNQVVGFQRKVFESYKCSVWLNFTIQSCTVLKQQQALDQLGEYWAHLYQVAIIILWSAVWNSSVWQAVCNTNSLSVDWCHTM